MPEKPPVAAVVPNYNMALSLGKLIPQILEQGYDGGIYILDDASTDGSREVAKRFGGHVTLVEGKDNRGPGGNRNHILEVDGHALGGAILHFIDADVTLNSENNPRIAREIFTDTSIGCAGGLIQLPDGTQWAFNYGPRYSLYSYVAGSKQYTLSQLLDNPDQAKRYRQKHIRWLRHSPNLLETPTSQDTFWVGEANMLVPYDRFEKLGGFDSSLRYHEIQDLAIRLHKQGLSVQFDPRISVTHPFIDMADQNRSALESRAALKIIRRHGLPLH